MGKKRSIQSGSTPTRNVKVEIKDEVGKKYHSDKKSKKDRKSLSFRSSSNFSKKSVYRPKFSQPSRFQFLYHVFAYKTTFINLSLSPCALLLGDNDVLVARDRLKGALREILHHSDDASSADDSEESAIQEYKLQVKKMLLIYLFIAIFQASYL